MKEKFGLFFEDFITGETIEHARTKTILESDNNLFSLLTMNHHPVHLDFEYCKETQHGQPLVVGTLVFSLVVGLTVSIISGKAIANLNYEKIEHLAPVFVNDTLSVTSTILEKRDSKSKPDRGLIRVESIAYNQNDLQVLKFRRNVLVRKRES